MAVAECYVWHSWEAKAANCVLLAAVLLCLCWRWSSERPRRTAWDFYTDVSKQIFGNMYLHYTNLRFSDYARRVTHAGDNCDWYLVSIILDCTLGSFLMIFILKTVHRQIQDQVAAEWIQEGDYRYSGIECNRVRRIKQIAFWVCVPVATARFLVVGLMCLLGGWLTAPLHSMFGGFGTPWRALITLVLVPMPLNICQFLYLDKNIRRPRELPPPTPTPIYQPPGDDPAPPPIESACGVPLAVGPDGMISRAILQEFFEHEEVRRVYGLELYTEPDIVGLIDKMMNGARSISEATAGFYLQSQLANARFFKACDKGGGGKITEEEFCDLLLTPTYLNRDCTHIMWPHAFHAHLQENVPPVRDRTYVVVSDSKMKLWESHKLHGKMWRLPDWFPDASNLESAGRGHRLKLGLLVRLHERTVMGMIVDDPSAPNWGCWIAMWNGADVWLKPEGEFSAGEREGLGEEAGAFYGAVLKEYRKIKEHAARQGDRDVTSRAFLTYFQDFMPEPSTSARAGAAPSCLPRPGRLPSEPDAAAGALGGRVQGLLVYLVIFLVVVAVVAVFLVV